MSSGDFAAELRQSVQDHIALVQTAAKAAKARIGQAIPAAEEPIAAPLPPMYEEPPASRDDTPRPAVNFFAEEPAFDRMPAEDPSFASALDAPPDPLPEGAISFDDEFASNVDDEGIPVWEDTP
jgi:hypothetical protein